MANIQTARSIYQPDGTTLDELKLAYGNLIQRIQAKSLSMLLKNTEYVNEPVKYGTVEVRRLAASVAKDYGTARGNHGGDKIKAQTVSVKIDQDKEIVEEIAGKDLNAYAISNLLQKRQADHELTMRVTLDSAYFAALEAAAQNVDMTGVSGLDKQLSKLIQTLGSVENDYVKGVDRELMVITLNSTWYDELISFKDQVVNPNGQNYVDFHGVRVYEAPRQTADAVIQVRGSVAQPVLVEPYTIERIPLSRDYAVSLFFYYGTKPVMSDLIFKATLSAA